MARPSRPCLLSAFDGSLDTLDLDVLYWNDKPHSVKFAPCKRGRKLYAAVLGIEVVGGHSWREARRSEFLFIELLRTPETITLSGISYIVPARFFWIYSGRRMRQAKLFSASDNMRSLALSCYERDREHGRELAIHRILAWTFKLADPLRDFIPIWSRLYDVSHDDDNHYNNVLDNLVIETMEEHRARSGRLGASVREENKRLRGD